MQQQWQKMQFEILTKLLPEFKKMTNILPVPPEASRKLSQQKPFYQFSSAEIQIFSFKKEIWFFQNCLL